jgi:hypothetical protein
MVAARAVLTRDAGLAKTESRGRLWRGTIPPVGLKISKINTGYWAWDLQADMSAFEALVIGSTPEEHADITGIAAEVNLSGVEVTYGTRPARSIGPWLGGPAKTLEIDGRGGERIVAVIMEVQHQLTGIAITTNRGRSLIVGVVGPESEAVPNSSHTSVCVDGCPGFMVFWTRDKPLVSEPVSVGMLSYPEAGHKGENRRPAADSSGLWWEPDAPPAGWVETGRLFGEREANDAYTSFQPRKVPDTDHGGHVGWLDCIRPVDTIRLTLVHGTLDPQIPLLGISFQYADGGVIALGPQRFAEQPADSLRRCACANEDGRRDDEYGIKPHYRYESWQVGGKRLSTVRLWMDEKFIAAMQLVDVEGNESPCWGYPEDEYTDEIQLGEGVGEAPGLKLYWSQDSRSFASSDWVMAGLQAMGKK